MKIKTLSLIISFLIGIATIHICSVPTISIPSWSGCSAIKLRKGKGYRQYSTLRFNYCYPLSALGSPRFLPSLTCAVSRFSTLPSFPH